MLSEDFLLRPAAQFIFCDLGFYLYIGITSLYL